MPKPIEKPVQAKIVHHPSDVLDSFCCYDSSNDAWKSFNGLISRQIADFELSHPQYIRTTNATNRRSKWHEQR